MTLPSLRRGRRRGRGQALLEFAFVLPIFLLILMILFDFGRVVYAQHTIDQYAREGARVGQVEASGGSIAAIRNAVAPCVNNPGGDCGPSDPRSMPGILLTGADIFGGDPADASCPVSATPNDDFYPGGVTPGYPVVVNVRIVVPIITPIISNVLGGSRTICAHAVGFIQ
jgi:Flp pilus assembly protein TadG